ncbi:MAG TPA: hypothetical protein VGC45_11395 [Gryllotalpicola sp.]
MTDASRELPARLPPDESPHGKTIDARLHLLDRQIIAADGTPLATVDDLELEGIEPDGRVDSERAVRVTALLSGPVLWTRIFGGRPRPDRLDAVPWRAVEDVDVVVTVTGAADDYPVSWTERWVRERIIGRIPGGRHAPE